MRPEASQEGSLEKLREEIRPSEIQTPYEALDVSENDSRPEKKRFTTGMVEFDRVLGGGMVPDSFTLLGGDPGIGKSTLLLQMAHGLVTHAKDLKVLYVSGEESITQVRSRGRRLGVEGQGRVFLASETLFERVLESVQKLKPQVLIVDSLQTFSSAVSPSAPGSVSQVREVTARLMTLAKSAGIAVWLVGHVTKEGSIAGPKTVEHMVDTVLYFEGEGGLSYRLLRAVKNRYGSAQELGVFEMESEGLKEVQNPSSLFLSERSEEVHGTAIAASLEGTRPILVELQALVSPSGLALPRRTAVGFESQRISLLSAILERHLGVQLATQDLYFNVSGGLKLAEPACDLAAAAAIWSSFEARPISHETLWMGELALTGEVRRVSQTDVRLSEAQRLGFRSAIISAQTPKSILERDWGMKIMLLDRIRDLPNLMRVS
jgi:DNA repair protein RadA/Sms